MYFAYALTGHYRKRSAMQSYQMKDTSSLLKDSEIKQNRKLDKRNTTMIDPLMLPRVHTAAMQEIDEKEDSDQDLDSVE